MLRRRFSIVVVFEIADLLSNAAVEGRLVRVLRLNGLLAVLGLFVLLTGTVQVLDLISGFDEFPAAALRRITCISSQVLPS